MINCIRRLGRKRDRRITKIVLSPEDCERVARGAAREG
jgi:hypothetical protein